MENEEVIRHKMEQTRESLNEKLETLEEKVTSSVATVTDTVASVKEKVHEGVESVKDAVDVQAHVERHPWLMLGGSVLCGFVLGELLSSKSDRATKPAEPRMIYGNGRQLPPRPEAAPPKEETPPAGASWLGAFEPEMRQLKSLALGVTLGTVREMLTEQVPPHMAGQLREIVDAVTKKAGGDPIPSSDWDSGKPAPAPDAQPECSAANAQNPRW
jgi:ElaB/YqjD/DUF883 family membrane-anchored ribosome-binding protein